MRLTACKDNWVYSPQHITTLTTARPIATLYALTKLKKPASYPVDSQTAPILRTLHWASSATDECLGASISLH